ncbi:triose-phosphate isomerase [Candidatus Woesearchaeota archaeon]|nr:triose-phosphate isomerase [Candidatus Woesearchaeota archaeon]
MNTLVINFKTYKQGTGKVALVLAKKIENIAKKFDSEVILCVQPTDIQMIAKTVTLPVFCQHMDAITYGKNTGRILPEAIKEAGASGVLVNHSECPLDPEEIEDTVIVAKKLKLKTIVCCQEIEEIEQIIDTKPTFIAIEPPELIGRETSVSEENPELIDAAVHKVGKNLLVGAGIKNKEDVQIAKEAGAAGVLVASHIVQSKAPEKVIKELLEGMF